MTVLSQVKRPGPSVRPFTMPRMRRDWGRRSPFFNPNVSTGTRFTSSPEQKWGPVAASTMTLTSSSSSAASNFVVQLDVHVGHQDGVAPVRAVQGDAGDVLVDHLVEDHVGLGRALGRELVRLGFGHQSSCSGRAGAGSVERAAANTASATVSSAPVSPAEGVGAEQRRSQVEVGVALPGVAHASVQLDGRLAHPAGGRRGPRLGRGPGDQGLARGQVVHGPGRPVGRGARTLQVDQHVRAQVLDGLERADRPAELLPGGHVGQGGLEGPGHGADQAGGQPDVGHGQHPVDLGGLRLAGIAGRRHPADLAGEVLAHDRRGPVPSASVSPPAPGTSSRALGTHSKARPSPATGGHRSCWSRTRAKAAVPAARSARRPARRPSGRRAAAVATTRAGPVKGAGTRWRASCSATRQPSSTVPPEPPRSSGTTMPSQPISASSARTAAWSTGWPAAAWRSRAGPKPASAHRAAVSASAWCSSDRANLTGPPGGPVSRPGSAASWSRGAEDLLDVGREPGPDEEAGLDLAGPVQIVAQVVDGQQLLAGRQARRGAVRPGRRRPPGPALPAWSTARPRPRRSRSAGPSRRSRSASSSQASSGPPSSFRKWKPPTAGIRPTAAQPCWTQASRPKNRRSQARARSKPRPMAGPSTAATTGTRGERMRRIRPW